VPYVSGSLGTGIASAAAAGRPCVLTASRWRRLRSGGAGIRWSTTGVATDPSIVDASYPVRHLTDGIGWTVSRAATASVTGAARVYLTAELDEVGAIEAVAVWLESVSDWPAGSTLVAQIADNTAFSSNLVTLATMTPRVGWNVAMLGNRYTSARYVRLRMGAGAGTPWGTATPSIRQVVMGARYQLGRRPREPFDDDPRQSIVSDFVADSGARIRQPISTGRSSLSVALRPHESNAYGFDDVARIRSAYSDGNNGAEPWLWISDPSSSPITGRWCLIADASLDMPIVQGPTLREVSLDLEEQPPYLSAES